MLSNPIAGALLILLAGLGLAFTPALSEEGHWIPSQTQPVWPGQSLPLASTTKLDRIAKAVRVTKLTRTARAVRAKKLARTAKAIRATQLARTTKAARVTQLARPPRAVRTTQLARTAKAMRVTQLARGKKPVPVGLAREASQRARTQDHGPTQTASLKKMHRVVIQVTQNDPTVMNTALNNAENLAKSYQEKGEEVEIEFVAYGPGLHMVRSDSSPVKSRLTALMGSMKKVTFSGCGNTMNAHAKQENKEISLVPEARIVPTGIARVVELQEQGWSYVRP